MGFSAIEINRILVHAREVAKKEGSGHFCSGMAAISREHLGVLYISLEDAEANLEYTRKCHAQLRERVDAAMELCKQKADHDAILVALRGW